MENKGPGRPPIPGQQKYMFVSDQQSPFVDMRAVGLTYQVMKDFKPDTLFIVGDFTDCYAISDYPKETHLSLKDELAASRKLLEEYVVKARESNPNVELIYLYGNHEDRMERFLMKHAEELAELELDGERVNSLAHLLQLKKLGVKWQPYKSKYILHNASVEHGTFVSTKAGQTATKHVEHRGRSVIHGHTHRLGLVYRRVGDQQQFGMELGCLCKLDPLYSHEPNWTQGFAVATYDKESKVLYPQLIPIVNYMCMYGSKIYRG